MILIISDKNDIHTLKVEKYLKQNNTNFVKLNLDVESLKNTEVFFNGINWTIKNSNYEFNTKDIKTIWYRRTYVELLLEENDISDVNFKIWKGEWNKTLLGIYAHLEECKWLNFYRDAYYAENKYRQQIIAKKVGLKYPEFICSNIKESILNFYIDDNEKVIKFLNQDFYKMKNNEYAGIFVNKIKEEDFSDFKDTNENPVIIQNYIEKRYEVRYTVIGNEHFICKIDSQLSKIANIDWRRYDLANTPHSIIKEAPKQITDSVNRFLKEFNLNYGAIDFIIDNQDNWHFLEINSMGQFLWIEDLTGLKISESIAKWLINNN